MKSKVHPTYKTKYRVANWAAYNQALVRRGDVTVWPGGAAWLALLGTLRGHTTGMKSKVHPTYKTKYRVANWAAYNQALVRRCDGVTALTLLLYHLPCARPKGSAWTPGRSEALLHESELARTDPDPQFLHRPMRYDIGLPSTVI